MERIGNSVLFKWWKGLTGNVSSRDCQMTYQRGDLKRLRIVTEAVRETYENGGADRKDVEICEQLLEKLEKSLGKTKDSNHSSSKTHMPQGVPIVVDVD